MIMQLLGNFWSWSFVVGLVVGFLLSKLRCLAKVYWEDRHDPLPDGRRRSKWQAIATDRRWLIGMVAVSFVVWSVVTTSENASGTRDNAAEARQFAEQVKECQADLIVAINGSRSITTQNDDLSREERTLLADGQRLGRNWIGSLLTPPPDVARLPEGSPERNRYNMDVTRNYFDATARIQDRIDAIHVEQKKNERERPALPDPRCGQ